MLTRCVFMIYWVNETQQGDKMKLYINHRDTCAIDEMNVMVYKSKVEAINALITQDRGFYYTIVEGYVCSYEYDTETLQQIELDLSVKAGKIINETNADIQAEEDEKVYSILYVKNQQAGV